MAAGKSLIQSGLNSVSKPTETKYAVIFPCWPGSGNVSSHASHGSAGGGQQLDLGVPGLPHLNSSGPDAENQCRIARRERALNLLAPREEPILQPNGHGLH